jgi:hypothetical protein
MKADGTTGFDPGKHKSGKCIADFAESARGALPTQARTPLLSLTVTKGSERGESGQQALWSAVCEFCGFYDFFFCFASFRSTREPRNHRASTLLLTFFALGLCRLYVRRSGVRPF